MTDRDPELQTTLLDATPRPHRRGDWEDVMHRARRRRLPRWVLTRVIPVGAIGLAGAVLAVLFTRLATDAAVPPAGGPHHVSIFDRPQTREEAQVISNDPVRTRYAADSIRRITDGYYAGRGVDDSYCVLDRVVARSGVCGSRDLFDTQRAIVSAVQHETQTWVYSGLTADTIAKARIVGGSEVDVRDNGFVLTGGPRETVEVWEPGTGWYPLVDPAAVRFSVLERAATSEDRAAASFSFVPGSEMIPSTIRVAGTFDGTTIYVGSTDMGDVCVVSYVPRSFSTPTCSSREQIGLAGGLPVPITQTSNAAGATVVALVPDSVTRARTAEGDVTIIDNVIAARTQQPDALQLLAPSGWRELGHPAVAAPPAQVPSDPATLPEPRRAYVVQILNGSARSGVTSALESTLRALGWNVQPADTAPDPRLRTIVAYTPGREVVADNLARDLGIGLKRPVTDIPGLRSLGGVDALVVLGDDYRAYTR